MAGSLEPPCLAEGYGLLEVVANDADAEALLAAWGGAPVAVPSPAAEDAGLAKYPRTPHLANLGAATRGDKLLSAAESAALLSSGARAFVTEKLDGANLGLSISAEGRVRVQNRGHYVDAAYHEQFKPLDKWVASHTADLWAVLRADEAPGRYILFGEWLYARHSVPYTRLPDWFLAFDLYDRATGTFAAYDALVAVLAGTGIQPVPLVAHRALAGLEDAVALMEGPAAYGDAAAGTRREGVVVSVCEGGTVTARGKLVRAGFLDTVAQGRWNRGQLVPNALARV
jgi:atypical dual specificity phosphatase